MKEIQQTGLNVDICLMHGEEGMDNGNIVRELSSWKAFILKIYYLACFVYTLVCR